MKNTVEKTFVIYIPIRGIGPEDGGNCWSKPHDSTPCDKRLTSKIDKVAVSVSIQNEANVKSPMRINGKTSVM